VEKQEYFVKYARKNAILNSISYKLYETDFVKLEVEEKYDYIVSNPPFYPEGARKSENKMLIQARYNTALPMSAFFKKVSQLLKPQAHFIFCYDATQFGLICNELEKVKMRVIDVKFIHSKEDKPASLVLVHARNSSKSMMRVLAPIFNFIGNKYSKEAEIIFKNANTESIKCQL
jgi:tRNA1(Val) A37 N6-methylase TrmN6